jgi:CheY-like chemotaxis protein
LVLTLVRKPHLPWLNDLVPALQSAARKVLLIADSDEFTRDFAARLEREGAEVVRASSGAEALAALFHDFDLIVLDLDFPDTDALTLLQQLHNGVMTIPVLLLKGEGEPAHIVQRGLDFGASGYVIKHRVPRDLASASVLDGLFKASNGRGDSCPFSANREFGHCSVFLPLIIKVADDGAEPTVSCSHLRVGTSDTWRLYPRCALGDKAARDQYTQDRAPV